MKHYAKIISFANHKGGVGKTTTTASMGSILASKGYKVLLVDLDAQANLTSSLLKKEVTTTIYDGLKSQSSTSLYIYKVREDIRLDMIPADLNLAQADLELAGKMARERILSELLENYKSEYDYILIDCPPSLGLLTLNALTASDYVIIPLVAEVLPFNGLKMIFDFINQIKKFLNPKVNIFGIAITRWEGTKLSNTLYRDENELTYVKSADPLYKFHRMLIRYGRFTEEELKEIADLAAKDLKAANRKAMAAPDPDPSTVKDYVLPEPYQPQKYKEGVQNEEGEKETLVTAINKTLKAEFRHNPDTFIWGQDVANKEKGGVFNITKGMQQEFGIERVFNAPIAEDYIVGTANGMCRFDPKIHVVIEGAEFADYFWPAVEQYVECTHEYWRSNGQFTPNITLRLASGGYIGGGLYHSQTIEGALTSLPGARIVYPSFADDAAGLLRTSMRSKGFTLYLEPKALYNAVEASTFVPEDFEVPFGKARIRRPGKDLTIITYGNTTHLCLNVAELLYKEKGWELEVIDLRTLIPLDKEAIFNSVKKTSKVLIVHEDKVFSGFGAEIAGIIGSELFQYLDAPIQRVGSLFTPVGFHPVLERAILPNEETIYHAAKELLLY